jgi:hypothetical protein
VGRRSLTSPCAATKAASLHRGGGGSHLRWLHGAAAEAGIRRCGETISSRAFSSSLPSHLPAAMAARFDVLEVSGLLAYTSGGVGTHILTLAGGQDQGCLFLWADGVGDGLGQ